MKEDTIETKYSPKATKTLQNFKDEMNKINNIAKDIENELYDKDNMLTMEKLLNETIKFTKGEIELDDLQALADQMVIRSYLPMMDKLRAMMFLIFDMNNLDTEQHEVRILNLQKNLFFDILLGEYAGIKTLQPSLKTYSTYDILYPIWGNYLLQFCYDDYVKLEKMIEDSLNLYHVTELSELLRTVDYKYLDKISKENKEIVDKLVKSKELVKHLKDLYMATNPINADIADALQEQVMNELHEQAEEIQ